MRQKRGKKKGGNRLARCDEIRAAIKEVVKGYLFLRKKRSSEGLLMTS
jgi:hypothetical protein